MKRRTMLQGMGAGAMLSAMSTIAGLGQTSSSTVFELRVYHANEGKLDDLLARFRNHTMTIFKRHGMESVAYWVPTDEPLKGRTLFYILKHPSREAATANWAAFQNDPEWKQVSAASNANGKLVDKSESTFLTLTDFSPRV
jgi:NIPSNAP